MAIIYSYPETTQILLTDMLIGTSTIRIAGKKKNLTKNFTIETLGLFIQDNFPTATPSLNQVLTVGNTSLLNAKIGQLYLYDTSELDYGHIALADSGYDLYNALGGLTARIEGAGIILQGPTYNSQILTGSITANRAYTLPNASGTIALTSDIPSGITLTTTGTSGVATLVSNILNIPNYTVVVPTKTSDLINDGEDGINPFITAADIPPSVSTLNDVLTNGNTSLLDAKVGTLGLWTGTDYSKLFSVGGNFVYQNNLGINVLNVSAGYTYLQNSSGTTLELQSNGMSAYRTIAYPDASGTIALTSDIPAALTFTSPLVDTLGTITIDQSNTTTDGYLSSTDWNIFNDKQDSITLTTTGSSGAATFIANTLNIPNYSTDLSGYVPYTGAASDVDLGLNNLYTNKLYLFDEAEGESGSIHYADEALHFSNSEDETLLWVEFGFMQIHKTPTIQSNLFTENLTATRDHYLPNASGTIALTSDIPSLTGYVQDTRSISTTTPLQGGGNLSANRTLSILQSNTTQSGFLSNTDWNTFNGKFTLPALTSGSVLFSNGTTIAQDNSNLFWDDTNNRLNIGGIASNTARVGIKALGALSTDIALRVRNSADSADLMTLGGTATLNVNGAITTNAGNSIVALNLIGGNSSIQATPSNGTSKILLSSQSSNIYISTTANSFADVRQGGGVQHLRIGTIAGNYGGNLYSYVGDSSNGFYWNTINTAATEVTKMLLTTGGNLLLGTTTDIASSKLTIESTTQGFLPPRMTTTQKNAIATPASGLVVYDTTLGKLCVRGAAAWETITSI